MRNERRRDTEGNEYLVEYERYELSAKRMGSAGGKIGGKSRSEKKLAALARNRTNPKSDGRTPTTPDGIARRELRHVLESAFGKPLPKDGPIARLVHKMSSARTVLRVWPEVAEHLNNELIADAKEKVEALVSVLEQTGGSSSARMKSDGE